MSLPPSDHGPAVELIDTGIRILGPLEVVGKGRLWKIGGPRDQVVLAMLAMRAHTVVSVGQLIDGVWGDAPPPSARGQVQTSISTLRKLLGDVGIPHAIRTRPSGYVLEVSEEHLDCARFNALVAAANRHAAVDDLDIAAGTLNRALGLWRGPALDGLQSDLVRNTAAVLEEARLTVAEERLRLELDLGRHDSIIGELRALLAEYPWRERLYGFLMIALYRTGRQAEALEVYRQARAVLIADVGIEPGQELRDLERAVLGRDPSLDPRPAEPAPPPEPAVGLPLAEPEAEEPVDAPRQLPATIADFVGREDLISDITRILTGRGAAARHAMPVVAITGRGGCGKSALALRVAHELRDTFPDGHMYLDLRGPDCDQSTPALLERFLRALGVPGRLIPGRLSERLEMYRSRLADKRMLIVLDDAVSEAQVMPLFPGSASCGVIVTSRARLGGLPGAHRLDVGALGTDSAIELLARMVGADRLAEDRDAAAAVVRYCGRLPLALRIVGARLASLPHWRIGRLARRLADETNRLDELSYRDMAIRSSIATTYRELAEGDQRVFRWLAMIDGPGFPAWVAAALLGTDLADVEGTIDRLVGAHLLDVLCDGGRVRYQLPELVRLYAKELLTEVEPAEGRRAAAARVLGAWLALSELACREQFGAGWQVLRGSAPRVSLPEWTEDDQVGSPLEWLDRERVALVTAIRQAAALGLDELCWELALAAGRLFQARGHLDDWRETAELAHATAVRAANRAGTAAALYSLGSFYLHQRRFAAAGRRFDEAVELFEAAGDRAGQAVVRSAAAVVDRWLGRLGSRRGDYEAALATVRAAGDIAAQVRILTAVGGFMLDEGVFAEAGARLDEALELRGTTEVLLGLGEFHLRTHQHGRARRVLNDVLRTVRETGDEATEARTLGFLALVRRAEGQLDNAVATLAHVVALGERIGDRLVVAQAQYTLGDMAIVRADYPAAAAALDRARVAFRELGLALWLARTHLLLAEARAAVGAATAAAANLALARELSSAVESRQSTRLRRRVEAAASQHRVDEIAGNATVIRSQ